MYEQAKLTIHQVNTLTLEQFVTLFGNVVELCPDAALKVADKRPLADVWQLCDAFAHYLDSRPEHELVQILCSHPDLAGRLAQHQQLTAESSREQAAAGLQDIDEQQRQLIENYNGYYKEKFGFPFIICARQNKVKSIMDGLMQRCDNERSSEIATAVSEVVNICTLRILDIVREQFN